MVLRIVVIIFAGKSELNCGAMNARIAVSGIAAAILDHIVGYGNNCCRLGDIPVGTSKRHGIVTACRD